MPEYPGLECSDFRQEASERANTRLIRHERDVPTRRTRVRDFLFFLKKRRADAPLARYPPPIFALEKDQFFRAFARILRGVINSFEQKEM